LSDAAGGKRLPTLAVTLAYVRACDGDIDEWRRRWHEVARESVAGGDEHDPYERPPYAGLATFQADDAAWFHGRERFVDEIVARADEHRFVTVIGPSGTGKSSLLRAGFLPRVAASGSALVAVFTPGTHPFEECAIHLSRFLDSGPGAAAAELVADARGLHRLVRHALTDQPPETEIVLVIDQFEEMFTLCRDSDVRSRFVTSLITASRTANSRCRIVLGVRADFYPHCLLDPDLADALRHGQVAIGPMTVDELRRAIIQPARLANCTVEGALLATLVTHAHGRVGALPLLSHALLETWRRRSGNTLTLAGFERAGGIDGALANTAEAVFTSLDERGQSTARQLFLRLVALGEGTQDTKRRVNKEELDEDIHKVLTPFSDARLVILSEHGAELTHEALIEAWPRLRSWLVDDREGQRVHRHLTDATATWQEHDHDPGTLLRGARLTMVMDWARHHPKDANYREAAFLDASTTAEERDRTSRRRRSNLLRGLVALLVVLLIITTTMAIQAKRAQQTATQQSHIAVALNAIREAETLANTNTDLAAQISLAAYRLHPSQATKNSLITNVAATTAVPLNVNWNKVSLAPGGRLLTDAKPDIDVTALFAVHTGQVTWLADLPGGTYVARFSPDSRTLLTIDHTAVPRLWDISNPARPMMRSTMPTHARDAAYSPDGTLLITTEATWFPLSPSQSLSLNKITFGTGRVWNITDIERPRHLATLPYPTGPLLAFGEHGRAVTIGSSLDRLAGFMLWDLTAPARPRLTTSGGINSQALPRSATFTRNDQFLYLGDSVGVLTMWDLRTPAGPLQLFAARNNSPINDVMSSFDEHVLVSTDTEGQLTVWDITASPVPKISAQINSQRLHFGSATFDAVDHVLRVISFNTILQQTSLIELQMDPDQSAETLCAKETLRITEKDWRKYFPGVPYRSPCM
jgi:WD40 repeat protein